MRVARGAANDPCMRLQLALASCASLSSLHAQERVDFERQVAPLFVAHCIECHGPERAKGGLRLDTRAHAFPAVDGAIVPKAPDDSELLHRVTLPAGDVDIMPAGGAPLGAAQRALLRRWIEEGAEWPASGDRAIADALAARRGTRLTFDLPALGPGEADALERAVTDLRAAGAVVRRVAADTEALDVSFSFVPDRGKAVDVASLAPLAKRLVWLDLSRTTVTDEALAALANLPELRRLNVANTKTGDAGFSALAASPRLEVLNAYGTALGDAGLQALAGSASLRKLYAWRTSVTSDGAAAAAQNLRLSLELGAALDARVAAARKDRAERESQAPPGAKRGG